MTGNVKPNPSDPWGSSMGVEGYSREVFEGGTALLPELEIFGWLRFREALVNGLQPDRHEGALEIHYMKRGHLRWWVGDEEHEFSTGRVFVVKPGELHGGDGGAIQPCEHYWLRVRLPKKGGALPDLGTKESREILEGFEKLQARTFAVSAAVSEFFEQLHEEHRARKGRLAVVMARGLLHALLVSILREHDAQCNVVREPLRLTWQVRRTVEWLDANYKDSELKVDQLSESFGKSATVLRSRFKMETGYTPHEYVLHRRIEDARRELRDTKRDVTTIAHGLGFSSSQYFATVFRRQTGMTPSAFREKMRGK